MLSSATTYSTSMYKLRNWKQQPANQSNKQPISYCLIHFLFFSYFYINIFTLKENCNLHLYLENLKRNWNIISKNNAFSDQEKWCIYAENYRQFVTQVQTFTLLSFRFTVFPYIHYRIALQFFVIFMSKFWLI